MKYIICYDISDNKCRRQIVKYLESMARRMQYSVFLAECTAAKIDEVKKMLWALAAGNKDSYIIIAPLCQACEAKLLQYGKAREEYEACVIL